MEKHTALLEKNSHNHGKMKKSEVRKILLIYEELRFFIGDTCILFDKLKYVKSIFPEASVEVNFLNTKNLPLYYAFLENNPNFDNVNTYNWESIDFRSFDLILCISFKEKLLLDHLASRYIDSDSDEINFTVLSLSREVLKTLSFFPEYKELAKYDGTLAGSPYELYLSEKERDWADEWLERNGVKKHESLFIILDSASEREKMLNLPDYFELLKWILSLSDVKVLIFDEKKIGKKDFYAEWLEDELSEKLIFSEGLKLRQDFALIGSRYTRAMIGPCTGLMHCASGIYNNIYKNRIDPNLYKNSDAPLLLIYTGEYNGEGNSVQFWWGKSPLVNCLLVRDEDGNKEILLLHELSENESKRKVELPCEAYTSELLIDFLQRKMQMDSFYLPKNSRLETTG